jgi:chorismate mutase
MADTTSEREALILEIAEKVKATSGETMDAKQEEWVRGVVRAELESGGRGYRPQP